MSTNVFFSRINRQNQNNSLVQHKVKPCFLISKEKEFHPDSPCEVCFPSTSALHSSPCGYEELGVRNLLAVVKPNAKKILTSWCSILQEHFETLQIHWGQLEKLGQIKTPKLYVVIHQNKLDVLVLAYTLLAGLKEANIEFLNHNNWNDLGIQKFDKKGENDNISKVLFIDDENSEILLKIFFENDQSDVLLIPISIGYELSFDDISSHTSDVCELSTKWKPNVRVNFGLPHSFKDFVSSKKNESNQIVELKQHLRHEIWKNTPIMSFHILSMILEYRTKSKDLDLKDCVKFMAEFKKKFSQHHDLAFVGDLGAVTKRGLQDLSTKRLSSCSSVAVDVMKIESLMMKSLFSAMDFVEFDLHSDTCRVSQNRLLETYRKMARLLHHEIDFINPPCLSVADAEKKALYCLIDNVVLSLQSDEPNSSEQQMAKKIAYHLDVDSEEEEDWANMPVIDTLLYVNITNAISRRWIATITTTVLDVYYIAAKQLLELRKTDVMEEIMFVKRISEELNRPGHDSTIQNAIKLFKEEGIIESYSHSDVKILYLKDPLDEASLLRIVHDIAQFC